MDAKFCCACFESKINLLSCFDEKSPGITIASIINQHLDFKVSIIESNLLFSVQHQMISFISDNKK